MLSSTLTPVSLLVQTFRSTHSTGFALTRFHLIARRNRRPIISRYLFHVASENVRLFCRAFSQRSIVIEPSSSLASHFSVCLPSPFVRGSIVWPDHFARLISTSLYLPHHGQLHPLGSRSPALSFLCTLLQVRLWCFISPFVLLAAR